MDTPGTITEVSKEWGTRCLWDNGNRNSYNGKECFTLIETKEMLDRRLAAERKAAHV
jgi:hypothetical protein